MASDHENLRKSPENSVLKWFQNAKPEERATSSHRQSFGQQNLTVSNSVFDFFLFLPDNF